MMKINCIHSLKVLLLILTANVNPLFPQDVDIVPLLQKIERGNTEEVKDELADLKDDYPESPSVMFLEGVLTENGQQAVLIYQNVVDSYPDSRYADAALYRIFSYYYALGLYETARKKLNQLTSNYPESPYISIARENRFPDDGDLSNQDEADSQVDTQEVSKIEQEYRFTIQAGAFTNSSNAQSLMQNFERSGIYSEVRDKTIGGTTFHVVYVGKFVSLDDAESFLQVVNSRFNITGRVTPITW